MKVTFAIVSGIREQEEEDLIRLVAGHDPDYAALMARQDSPSKIDRSMLQAGGSGSRLLSPHIPDEAAKEFLLELMQRAWCSRIDFPGLQGAGTAIFYNRGVGGVVVTKRMREFMAGAAGDPSQVWQDQYPDAQAGAAALKSLMDQKPV